MFIELPNETRINTDHIISYFLQGGNTLYIDLTGESYGNICFDTEQEAEYFIQALDRAVGIKQLMIRK